MTLPEWIKSFFLSDLLWFKFIPILLGIIPLILRMYTNAQIRALRMITNEIIKINDFSIEFLELYKQLKKENNRVNKVDIVTLHTLRRKIDYHLGYLEFEIAYFPYGLYSNPKCLFLNNIFFTETDKLFIEYRNCLRSDTILDRDIEYLNTDNTISYKNTHLEEVDYDNMIQCSTNLIKYLENHILSKTSHTFRLFMKKIIQISTKK